MPIRFVFGRIIFAAVELGPEFAIGRPAAIGGLDKHAVILALDLRERVTHRAQKILVGGDDAAVHIELDDCLRLAGGSDLRGQIQIVQPERRIRPFDRYAGGAA